MARPTLRPRTYSYGGQYLKSQHRRAPGLLRSQCSPARYSASCCCCDTATACRGAEKDVQVKKHRLSTSVRGMHHIPRVHGCSEERPKDLHRVALARRWWVWAWWAWPVWESRKGQPSCHELVLQRIIFAFWFEILLIRNQNRNQNRKPTSWSRPWWREGGKDRAGPPPAAPGQRRLLHALGLHPS